MDDIQQEPKSVKDEVRIIKEFMEKADIIQNREVSIQQTSVDIIQIASKTLDRVRALRALYIVVTLLNLLTSILLLVESLLIK